MEASLNEVILRSFRVDAESLRDLDSIIKQRSSEINPAYTVTYEIYRKDSVLYQTADVEELIKERNGSETRIQQVTVKVEADSPGRLEFRVFFVGSLSISGKCDDRAKLLLLASDVRALVRERMRSRSLRGRTRLVAAAAAVGVGLFGYMVFSLAMSAHYTQKYDNSVSRSVQIGNRQALSQAAADQAFLNEYRSGIGSNSINSELSFLVQAQVNQIRADIASYAGRGPAVLDIDPWWVFSIPLLLGAACTCGVLVLGITYAIYPTSEAVFVIGDEIRRQANLAQIRERLVWGVGITFLLGVASALVVSAL